MKHNGFHVPDHQESIARMQMRSTLPLEIKGETKPISTQSVLEENQEPVQKILSRHTRQIDSWLSINDKSLDKQVVLLPFDRQTEILNNNNDIFISASETKTKIEENKGNIIEDNKIEEAKEKISNDNKIEGKNGNIIEDNKIIEQNIDEKAINNSEKNEEVEEKAELNDQSKSEHNQKQEEKQNQIKKITIPNFDTEFSKRRRLVKKFGYFTAEPCSYNPNFDAIYSSIPITTMQSREIPPPSPPLEVYSSAEVAEMYKTNLRNFDTKKISIKKYEELDIQYPNEKLNSYDYVKVKEIIESDPSSNYDSYYDSNLNSKAHSQRSDSSQANNKEKTILKPSSIFLNKVPRDEIFRNNSPSKHLSPGEYDIPEPKAATTLDMSKLHDRDFPVKPDPNRNYPLAIEQADKLKPKKPFHEFSKDTSRETKVHRNSRIELLDKLKQDGKELMKDLVPLARNASKKNSSQKKVKNVTSKNSRAKDIENMVEENIQNWKAKTSKTPKKKGQFDIQSSRPQVFWPGQKIYSNRDPVYPFDPIQSFNNTRPKSRVVEIRNKPKPLEGQDFWKKTWIGT